MPRSNKKAEQLSQKIHVQRDAQLQQWQSRRQSYTRNQSQISSHLSAEDLTTTQKNLQQTLDVPSTQSNSERSFTTESGPADSLPDEFIQHNKSRRRSSLSSIKEGRSDMRDGQTAPNPPLSDRLSRPQTPLSARSLFSFAFMKRGQSNEGTGSRLQHAVSTRPDTADSSTAPDSPHTSQSYAPSKSKDLTEEVQTSNGGGGGKKWGAALWRLGGWRSPKRAESKLNDTNPPEEAVKSKLVYVNGYVNTYVHDTDQGDDTVEDIKLNWSSSIRLKSLEDIEF